MKLLKSKSKNLNCRQNRVESGGFRVILSLLCIENPQAQMKDSIRYCETKEPVCRGGGRELAEASESKNLLNIA